MLKKGDEVIVKHQKEQGIFVVEKPHDPTDILRVGTKEPVGFYVRIGNKRQSNLGYHLENLEKVKT